MIFRSIFLLFRRNNQCLYVLTIEGLDFSAFEGSI
jgi:hypothetical protein